jgi:hypothetical protein
MLLSASTGRWRLIAPPGIAIVIEAAEYSPSYGVRVPCVALDISSRVDLAGERTWEFSIVPW